MTGPAVPRSNAFVAILGDWLKSGGALTVQGAAHRHCRGRTAAARRAKRRRAYRAHNHNPTCAHRGDLEKDHGRMRQNEKYALCHMLTLIGCAYQNGPPPAPGAFIEKPIACGKPRAGAGEGVYAAYTTWTQEIRGHP